MKNLIFAIVAIATFTLASCNGNASKTEETSTIDSTSVVTDSTSTSVDTTAVDTTTK